MNSIQQALDRIASREVDANLPLVTAADNGKILKVASGEWSKADIVPELPAVTASDNGKVLMVVEGAWAVASLPTDETEETT